MKKALKGFLKRKTELGTALEIKQSGWTPEKSVELLEKLALGRAKLHVNTITTLQTHIQSFKCPLSRYAGLSQLRRIGEIDPVLAASSHAHYGEFEQAIAKGYTSDLNDTKIRSLLEIGAVNELVDLILATDYKLTTETWNLLIQALVQAKEYSRAQTIWFRKPWAAKAPYSTIRQLFILAAQHQDPEMVAELEPQIPKGADVALQRYLLDAFDDPTMLISALRTTTAMGGTHLLAQNLFTVLPMLENEPAGFYNSILLGCFNHYTSLFVFGVYQYLISTGFKPDQTSAQILANACFRLGNSKLVSYQVWKEMVLNHKIKPTRKFLETLIHSQFNGIGVRTTLFFLYQMRSQAIYLRNDLHFQLIGQFAQDTVYTQLYGDFRRLAEFAVWDHQLAISESGKYAGQAQRNADAFCTGKTLQDLKQMYHFELTRDHGANPTDTCDSARDSARDSACNSVLV